MKEIDALMKKGEENLSQKELERLRILAEAAENYEDTHEPLPSFFFAGYDPDEDVPVKIETTIHSQITWRK